MENEVSEVMQRSVIMAWQFENKQNINSIFIHKNYF